MEEVIKYLENEIKDLEKITSGLNINSMDYMYWNGCRCQASATLETLKKMKS